MMNCRDIDRLIDDHRLSSLGAAERADVNAHVARCAGCAGTLAAHDQLQSERVSGPRPGFFEQTVRFVSADSGAPPRRRFTAPAAGTRWAAAGAGALAALTLAVLVIAGLGTTRSLPPPLAADVADVTDDAADAAARYAEGAHFARIGVPAPLDGIGNRITVWLFYMWSCYFCYELEPALQSFVSAHESEDIDFVRVPVQWNGLASLHARAHYTAEALNVGDSIRAAFFDEIHRRGNALDSRNAIAAMFAAHGIDRATFADTFDSTAVDNRMTAADRLATEFAIDSTPSVVVDGVYKTNPQMAGSAADMLDVVDWLIAELSGNCEQAC